MQALASFLCGLIFGSGLMISGMTQPAKVLGFLDIFGRWDPTLAFVMAGALAISGVGYTLARHQRRPVIAAGDACADAIESLIDFEIAAIKSLSMIFQMRGSEAFDIAAKRQFFILTSLIKCVWTRF